MWTRLEDILVDWVGKGIGVVIERRDLPEPHRHALNDLDPECQRCKRIIEIWEEA